MQKFITDRLPEIEELCRKHHVRRMSVFGSAVRDDFNPATSDVDFTVQFEAGIIPAQCWGVYELKNELEVVLNRKVDLLRLPIRNTYLRREIEGAEVTVYGA